MCVCLFIYLLIRLFTIWTICIISATSLKNVKPMQDDSPNQQLRAQRAPGTRADVRASSAARPAGSVNLVNPWGAQNNRTGDKQTIKHTFFNPHVS